MTLLPHAVPLEGDARADWYEDMREARDDAMFSGEPFPAPFAADPAWLDAWYIYAQAGMDFESGRIIDPARFDAHERDYLAYQPSGAADLLP